MTWRTQKVKNLANTLLSLKGEEEMLTFLRDLCSLDELVEISNRWEIVKRLETGATYREIAKDLKVSTATVTRVSKWVKEGKGGFGKALKK